MVKYNANPKGWKTGDCVVRAIALATNQTWDQVFLDLNKVAFRKKRLLDDPCVYNEYLKQLGWEKKAQPRYYNYESGYRTVNYDKLTIYEFIRDLNHSILVGGYRHEAFLITVAHHMTCVKFDKEKCRYDLYDIWDCGEKTIGNYWVKEN